MQKGLRIFVVMLSIPLLFYSTGYAYAAMTTSTYNALFTSAAVPGCPTCVSPGVFERTANCNTGDFATGGGARSTGTTIIGGRPFPDTAGAQPTGWTARFYGPMSGSEINDVWAICMTPVTVAGIGVPEFGSLYAAIALGAVVYFMLSRYSSRKPSLPLPA